MPSLPSRAGLGPVVSLAFAAVIAAQTPPPVLGLGSPTAIPGIGGSLLLDLTTLVLLPPHVMGASEHAGLDVPVPNLPGLTGVHVAFQGAWLTAAAISFGANATHVVLQ